MANFSPFLTPKTPVTYRCDICDFISSNKKDYNRHLMTRKHKRLMNATNETEVLPNIQTDDLFKCFCGKKYKHEPSLYKHKKKCSMNQEQSSTNIIPTNEKNTTGIEIDKELLIKMLLKNQDIMENVISKNQEVMEKMMEIMPNIGNNITNSNNNNTTNNQFNIQMFLNDHCKNAMNLTDFIDTLPITPETYDSTIDNGLTKTITNMITNGLSQLDILERPIHCTDASRKTLYVKEDNIWEKDNELVKILLGIRQIASKQRTLINKWKDVNAGWDTNDRMQSRFTTLICNSITDIENEEKETNKIIRSISKTVYLNNETKNQYLE